MWCLIGGLIWGIWARPKALHYAGGRECMVRIAVAAFVFVGGVLVGGMVAWFSIVVEGFWCSIRCCEGLCRVRAGRFSWFWWQWPQGPSAQHGSFRRAFSGNQQKSAGGVVQVAGVQSAAADSGSWMRQGQKAEWDTFFLKQYCFKGVGGTASSLAPHST